MDEVPQKVFSVWEEVSRTGEAPEGFAGGRKFANRERLLPTTGSYREYDVDPRPKGGTRNAERLVIDKISGEAWYTDDHYGSFVKLERWDGDL